MHQTEHRGTESGAPQHADGAGAQASADAARAATWDRVALAISAAEPHGRDSWRQRFHDILAEQQFVPGLRIQCAAGAHNRKSLCDCVGVPPLVNSLEGALDALRYSAICLEAGMDVAVDFSGLQPAQSTPAASGLGGMGPVPLAQLWSRVAGMLGGKRSNRGRVSVTLRCDHPGIEHFIETLARPDPQAQLCCHVLLSDAFMEAVQEDAPWPLVFPLATRPVPPGGSVCERVWPGQPEPRPCLVHKTVPARSLWNQLVQAQHRGASLRLVFSDRMQSANNLWYAEQLHTVSPAGHVPLAGPAACVAGTIHLPRFVQHPYGAHPDIDWQRLRYVTATAVRFLDDVYDVSPHVLKPLDQAALATRRLGLGISGLASMFAMLGLHYGSEASLDLTGKLMSTLREAAWTMSSDLAREKGSFAACDKLRHAGSPMVLDLPHVLQDAIAVQGMRNSHLLAVGPQDGFAGGLEDDSPGIEPLRYMPLSCPFPGRFAREATAQQQLDMASVVQAFVDNAVAVNIRPEGPADLAAYADILQSAWTRRLKNCLVVRGRQ